MMTSNRLKQLTERFPSKRIIVVGDFFLDKYLDFDSTLAETSLETGKVANQVINVRHSPGAAGASFANLVSLGAAWVMPVGFSGDDGEGYELRQDLTRMGCSTEHILTVRERHTPTYLKPRDINVPGIEGEAERLDMINREPLPQNVEQKILHILEELVPQADAVVIEDQVETAETGVLTTGVRTGILTLARKCPEVIFWTDSRRRIGMYRHVILKPNRFEAAAAVFPSLSHLMDEETATQASMALSEQTGKPVFLTRSEHGILVADKGRAQLVPGVEVRGPIDPTGAGASATAGAVLTLAAGGTLMEAALVANLVGSITVRQIGVCGTASRADLPACLDLWWSQQRN